MLKRLLSNRIVAWILAKLGPVPGAIESQLNVRELIRIAVTAAVMGGGFTAILPALVSNVELYVTHENVALVVSGITFVTEAIRRFGHGRPVSPAT